LDSCIQEVIYDLFATMENAPDLEHHAAWHYHAGMDSCQMQRLAQTDPSSHQSGVGPDAAHTRDVALYVETSASVAPAATQ